MKLFTNYIKGIAVGIGGIAPGLSGSVMLIVLGLYEKVLKAISTLFKGFKKNILFLTPLMLGFASGILIFSKAVDFFINNYEFETRYLFFGLALGTVPLFYKSVKKHGFKNSYYIAVLLAAVAGLVLFSVNKNMFPTISSPSTFQSVLLGVAVAGSSIIPGVDSAVILSALGLYELYVSAIANLNFAVLIPAGFGLLAGALLISLLMRFLIKHCYTLTFSIIFGMFLSIIPNVLNANCQPHAFFMLLKAAAIAALGFLISYYLGNSDKIKGILRIKKDVKKD